MAILTSRGCPILVPSCLDFPAVLCLSFLERPSIWILWLARSSSERKLYKRVNLLQEYFCRYTSHAHQTNRAVERVERKARVSIKRHEGSQRSGVTTAAARLPDRAADVDGGGGEWRRALYRTHAAEEAGILGLCERSVSLVYSLSRYWVSGSGWGNNPDQFIFFEFGKEISHVRKLNT